MTLVRHHSFFGSVFIDTDYCGQGIPPQKLLSSSHLAITIWSLPNSSVMAAWADVWSGEKLYPSADTVNELLFAVGTENKQKRNMTKTTLNKDLN